MARRGSKKANGLGAIILLIFGGMVAAVEAVVQFIADNKELFIISLAVLATIFIICIIVKGTISKQRRNLLSEILSSLNLDRIDSLVCEYDDRVVVKSHQTLDNYNDLKYIKENDFEAIRKIAENRKKIKKDIGAFLKDNEYMNRPQYKWVSQQLDDYMQLSDGYRVLIVYITSAGNNRGQRILHINSRRVDELISHPEMLMTKGEYNKLLKKQEKDEIERKKHSLYDQVNEIIDYANNSKEELIVKAQIKNLDELVQKLFDKTVNAIQKISKLESDEWDMLEGFIDNIEKQIHEIVDNDKRISDYYKSGAFGKIKETCALLTQSQREFNEYIDEKAKSIIKLFGTRVVRNETENEDVYNYKDSLIS